MHVNVFNCYLEGLLQHECIWMEALTMPALNYSIFKSPGLRAPISSMSHTANWKNEQFKLQKKHQGGRGEKEMVIRH